VPLIRAAILGDGSGCPTHDLLNLMDEASAYGRPVSFARPAAFIAIAICTNLLLGCGTGQEVERGPGLPSEHPYVIRTTFPQGAPVMRGVPLRVASTRVGAVADVVQRDHRILAIIDVDPFFSPVGSDGKVLLRTNDSGRVLLELDPGAQKARLPSGGVLPGFVSESQFLTGR